MDPILVTGGTGTLGRHVVRRLNSAGHHIRVFTRQPRHDEKGVSFARGDLLSGIGLDAAVAGVATIIHCAGGSKGDDTRDAESRRRGGTHRTTAPRLHLGRGRRSGARDRIDRSHGVWLLRDEAEGRTDCGKLSPSLDDPSRHSVSRSRAPRAAEPGQAADRSGSVRFFLSADRF